MNNATLLYKAAQQQKLAHAYIFSGNDAGAKKECIEQLTSFLKITSPDFLLVTSPDEKKSDEIPIGEIRNIATFLSTSPWNSPYKVVHVPNAHLMNFQAQTALLKILEEPLGNSVLFLETDRADLLLQTVQSRAQEIKFYIFENKEPLKHTPTFNELAKADLAKRFEFAKTLSTKPETLPQLFTQWQVAARTLLHETLQTDIKKAYKIAHFLRITQETQFLIAKTNINLRLALERIFLTL